jgi:hypothetical protein
LKPVTLQTAVVVDLMDFAPSLVVEIVAVKLPSTIAVAGRLVIEGVVGGTLAFATQANEVERSCEPATDLTREHAANPVPMEYFSVTRPPAAGRVVELTLIDAEVAASATAGMATVASVIESIVAMDALRNETNFMSTLESVLV